MSARLSGRNGEIWRAYCRGETQESIAARYDLSQPHVSDIIKAVRDSLPAHVRADAVQEVRDHLREMRAEAARVADLKPVPVYHPRTGEILCDTDGKPVYDYSGKLRAMETALKFMESERKLLGLDAAQKIEQTVTDQTAAMKTAKEARERLEGTEE